MPGMPIDLEHLTVAQAMRNKVVTIAPNQTLGEAAAEMRTKGVTALMVMESGALAGIITERDLGRAIASDGNPASHAVGEFMTRDVIAALSDWSLERAARTMAAGGFRHLLVFDNRDVVGILSMRDIVGAWARDSEPDAEQLVDVQTGEMTVAGDAHKYLYSLRRSAKQHLAATKCPCEWEWHEVLVGQLEDRPGLDRETLRHMWELRDPCPALHAEGGGAD